MAPVYPIPGDRSHYIAAVRYVKFNDWGIGFASISPNPKYPLGGIFRSVDRGKTWHQVTVQQAGIIQTKIYSDDVTFKDSLIGWFTMLTTGDPRDGGGAIFMTTDGGMNWHSVFSDNTSQPRAIYFSRDNSLLYAAVWKGFGLLVSYDEGKNWKFIFGPTTYGLNGVCAMDSVLIIPTSSPGSGHQIRSTDYGATWTESGTAISGIECYQPYADSSRHLMYMQSDASDIGPNFASFYQSTDYGLSWREMHLFEFHYFYDYSDGGWFNQDGAINGCIAGDAAGNLYIQKVTEGMWMSSDSGSTWIDICGPSNKLDTRFCVYNNTLFAGGYDGIWALPLGVPKRILLDSSFTVVGSDCHGMQKMFHLSSTYPCPSAVTLDTVTLSGSPAFTLAFDTTQRFGIATDSLLIDYQPVNQRDTAQLHFHFFENGIAHDTSITIYGERGSPVNLTCYLKSSNVSLHAGDTVAIPIYLDGADSLAGVSTANIAIALANDILEPINFTPSITGVTLSGALTYANGNEQIPLALQNISLHGETLLGYLRCAVYLTDTLGTSVTLTDATISSVDPRCVTLTTSSEAVTIAVVGCGDSILSTFLKHEASIRTTSIRPNPARGEVTLDVNAATEVNADIEISNALGVVVQRLSREFIGGANTISIDTHEYPAGMYFVRLSAAGSVVSQSFVKE